MPLSIRSETAHVLKSGSTAENAINAISSAYDRQNFRLCSQRRRSKVLTDEKKAMWMERIGVRKFYVMIIDCKT